MLLPTLQRRFFKIKFELLVFTVGFHCPCLHNALRIDFSLLSCQSIIFHQQ